MGERVRAIVLEHALLDSATATMTGGSCHHESTRNVDKRERRNNSSFENHHNGCACPPLQCAPGVRPTRITTAGLEISNRK